MPMSLDNDWVREAAKTKLFFDGPATEGGHEEKRTFLHFSLTKKVPMATKLEGGGV